MRLRARVTEHTPQFNLTDEEVKEVKKALDKARYEVEEC